MDVPGAEAQVGVAWLSGLKPRPILGAKANAKAKAECKAKVTATEEADSSAALQNDKPRGME
jgi:hypothetical protein